MTEKESSVFQFIFDIFSGKSKTKIYTTFLGWILFFHIDIIFIALILDQSLIYKETGLLKGDYLINHVVQLGIFWSIAIELARIFLSIAVTYLMIWVLPSLINEKAYKQELQVEYALRKMKLIEDEKLTKKEDTIAKEQQKTLDVQLKNIETEKNLAIEKVKLQDTPETVLWEKDYKTFQSLDTFYHFNRVIRCVYESAGSPSTMSSPRPDSQLLAYLDSNGVIKMTSGRISFTTKGKYFVKLFTENRNANF